MVRRHSWTQGSFPRMKLRFEHASSLIVVVAALAAAACGSQAPRSGVNGGATNADAASGAGDPEGAPALGSAGEFQQEDGGTQDSTECQHLNIGILGNQGSNPAAHFQTWLETSGTSVQRIQAAAPTPPLDAATLRPFDVVILDRLTRDYTPAEADVITAFVTGGGGLVSMSGYLDNTTDDWHANSLMTGLGVAYSGDRKWGPVVDFVAHPITAGLTSVTFVGGYPVADLGTPGAVRTALGFLNPSGSKTPVGYAIQAGLGRALVWGDEWIEYDSEWNNQPEIKQLWVQTFSWLAPSTKCEITPPK
jgi:hypothetical protein